MSTKMANLSSDIVSEILCKLPIEVIFRFRCVSKYWLCLIDSKEFSKLQLKQSLRTNSNLRLILRETDDFELKKRCFYSLTIDSMNSRAVTPQELKNPLKSCDFDTKILGSCHGSLLLSNDCYETGLWNPLTGQFKKLPVFEGGDEVSEVCHGCFGFGYDVLNDDYKVVRIVNELDVGSCLFASHVKVYSLKLDAWKVVEEFPFFLQHREGAYLDGALHWVASGDIKTSDDFKKMLIVAFDLGTERCRVVPSPKYLSLPTRPKLTVLGGCLCLLQSFYEESYYAIGGNAVLGLDLDQTVIWVMKEYGLWSPLMRVQCPGFPVRSSFVPLVYSSTGEEVLLECENSCFSWTSISDDSSRTVDVLSGGIRSLLEFHSYLYMGSLIQLGDRNKHFTQHKGGQTKIGNKRKDDFLSKGFKLKL